MGSSRILFRSSVIAAFAGFLFGFDTVVISGAEQKVQSLWELTDLQHGLAVSMALWGTVLGSFVGGWPTDRYGRTKTLQWIGVLYFVSAIWSGLATDVYSFMVARLIGGVGVGVSTVAAPLYISEIAPPHLRGRLAGMFQFNIVFGILIAFLSNALLENLGENAWRWMLGVEAIPALLYALFCVGLPESPRWLIAKRANRHEAINVLRQVNSDATEDEIEQIAVQIEAASGTLDQQPVGDKPHNQSSVEKTRDLDNPYSAGTAIPGGDRFWSTRLKKPILLAFLIAFFNQLSGINAVLYFAPRIFEFAGLGKEAALLQSVGIGITNLLFTFVGLWLIDKLGRRTLLYVGSLGYIASLGLCSWAFFTETVSIVPACIFAFIAAHAVGQGAVIWVFIAEIFPNQHRAEGQALGSFTHWTFAALLTLFFPKMVTLFAPGYVFLFFCGMMILQLLWVATMVPETKGIPLEQIQLKLGIE